ncbi:MAG: hypothetical protein RR731_02645, partial [Oscillospiraceae bacterium]
DAVVFETTGDIYITGAKLCDIVSISPLKGKIIPIMNGPKPMELFVPTPREEPGGTAIEVTPPPFSLFDFDSEGIEKNALILYHKSIFDADIGISLRIKPLGEDGTSKAWELADPENYRWSRSSENGTVPMDAIALEGDCVVLSQNKKSHAVKLNNTDFFAVCVEALKPVSESVILSDIRISSVCADSPPEFVLHNNEELDTSGVFFPFGDTASLFDECFIGHNRLFAQQGAEIRLRFKLDTREKLVDLTSTQEDAELKIIKRKPKAVLFETATTSPQRITVEYFNGIGWKRLSLENDLATLFNGNSAGIFDLGFICPEDWQPITTGGFDARMLRLHITQADNCYLRPCMHTMPIISEMSLSCSYENHQKQPQRLRAVCGTCQADLTEKLNSHQPFAAFSPLPYGCNALYMGLNSAPAGGPTSLLFDAEESILPDDFPLNFEYSSTNGSFKPLKVVDGTKSLTRSGTVVFLPPSDFGAMEVEGVRRYWLRLADTGEISGKSDYFRPLIKRLLLNAVEIRNVETLPEESFFIDVSGPNMSFPIAADSIYALNVYVSEMPKYSPVTMEQMAEKMQDKVRITHDIFGNITSFFVLWEEVESFDSSTSADRHYVIDRMTNTISFGDGVHVMIPSAQNSVAFTAQAICCKGRGGNLPAGAVNTLFDSALYLGTIYNPVPTFGGSDLETIASAQQRGASIVCGRNRLVSEDDYVREIRAFSETVEKVRCASGLDIWGREAPGLITIAIMSRNYADGAYSFAGLHDPLKGRLLARCEATVTEEVLCLCEPSYIKVSVDVWAQVENAAHSFDAQTLILDSLYEFLNPLPGDGRAGWDIGTLPTEEQLRQMIHALRFKGFIVKFIATARYVDETGAHEVDLEHLPKNPFAIAVNGTHRVFLELSNH